MSDAFCMNEQAKVSSFGSIASQCKDRWQELIAQANSMDS